MKGIIPSGGRGTRLYPVTSAISKQLLPVYDKPMIYYPLSVLMLAGIREVLIITAPEDLPQYRRLFGDGSDFGLRLEYAPQAEPNGIAEALVIGADFIGEDDVAIVLGDNIFHGPGFPGLLRAEIGRLDGCTLFTEPVDTPHHYGIAELDLAGRIVSLEEKPAEPRSDLAVAGLYLYDNDAVWIAAGLRPSARGELEITDVNREYLRRGRARAVPLGPDCAWFDAGTHESLARTAEFVRDAHRRQGARIACLEEIALRQGYISAEECHELGVRQRNSPYGQYVMEVADRFTGDLAVPLLTSG
jgi:glucose-1-phosphate thymidylyltransferase